MSSDNQRLRAAQDKAHEALVRAHARIEEARRRDPDLCRGFGEYGPGPAAALDQAGALLGRRTYRVAMAGMMSAGKSTLANALLRRPGLLPTGIEETTLTITVVTAPRDGREKLTVQYLTWEEALRGVFERGHYVKHLPAEAVARARAGAPAAQLREEVVRAVAEARMPEDVRQQLLGFLDALEQKRGLLGTSISPPLEDRRSYLAPRTHRDVGHLLLIARAVIEVENELFARDGLELVDLPGADSANERQRRIAFEYLADTDLLLAIPNAAGFRFVDIDVLARFREARGDIRERVFFVLNRMDEAKLSDLETREGSLAYLRKIVDTLQRDYDPGNLFFTVGLWAGLAEREPVPGSEDARELARVREASLALVSHFERQGVLEAIERQWPERWARRVTDSLRALRQLGGVDRLRTELVRYLKEDLELARLREVQAHLLRAQQGVEALVGPERSRVKGYLDSAREQLRATGGFLHSLSYATRSALERAHGQLAHAEGETEAYEFGLLVRRLAGQFGSAVQGVLSEDNDLIDLKQLAREAGSAPCEAVMQRVIDHARGVLSQKFVELLVTRLAPEVAERYRDALEPLDNAAVLDGFGRVIEQPGLSARYLERLETLEKNLALATRLRALEETWHVAGLRFDPTPGARSFEEVAPRFRKALIAELQTVYAERFRVLGGVLLRLYRALLDDFLVEFEELTALALREARLVGAQVPVELLAARASPEDRRRYGLAELVGLADGARSALEVATVELNGRARPSPSGRLPAQGSLAAGS